MSQEEAFLFERFIVQKPKAGDFPPEAVEAVEQGTREGVPTAFANHPELGKAVICSAGQGPMIVWRERFPAPLT